MGKNYKTKKQKAADITRDIRSIWGERQQQHQPNNVTAPTVSHATVSRATVSRVSCAPSQPEERAAPTAPTNDEIAFSRFAKDWNDWVAKLKNRHPGVTYKTASQLQDAFKVAKKNANQRTTLRPHRQNLDNLRATLCNEEENRGFIPEFTAPNEAYRAVPVPPTTAMQVQPQSTPMEGDCTSENSYTSEVLDTIQFDLSEVLGPNPLPSPAEVARMAGNKPPQQRRGRRCRQCGLVIRENLDTHKTPIGPLEFGKKPQSRHLISGKNVRDCCTVPESQYELGFPLADGKRFPRLKKRKAG